MKSIDRKLWHQSRQTEHPNALYMLYKFTNLMSNMEDTMLGTELK